MVNKKDFVLYYSGDCEKILKRQGFYWGNACVRESREKAGEVGELRDHNPSLALRGGGGSTLDTRKVSKPIRESSGQKWPSDRSHVS